MYQLRSNLVIDTTECYILILALVTLTFIQGHMVWKSKNFCAYYLSKFFIDFGGIWHTPETCCSDKYQTHLISSLSQCIVLSTHTHGLVYTYNNNNNNKITLACIQRFTYWFLSNLIWWQKLLKSIFWYKLRWPWPSYKVIVVWEIKTFGHHFLAKFLIDLDEI